jgi:hypothetical protein
MKYSYTTYDSYGIRLNIFTRFEEACEGACDRIEVWDNVNNCLITTLHTPDDVHGWQNKLERDAAWSGTTNVENKRWCPVKKQWEPFEDITMKSEAAKDHINPSHYQACFAIPCMIELQWLEHIQYHHHFKNPEVFKGAIELQIRKYLDRNGGKDEELQELKKAAWYLNFLIKYVEAGDKPIFVKDI